MVGQDVAESGRASLVRGCDTQVVPVHPSSSCSPPSDQGARQGSQASTGAQPEAGPEEEQPMELSQWHLEQPVTSGDGHHV